MDIVSLRWQRVDNKQFEMEFLFDEYLYNRIKKQLELEGYTVWYSCRPSLSFSFKKKLILIWNIIRY